MRILFDTNIILDVLLGREPFVNASAELMSSAERGEISGYLCASTVTTLFYLASKTVGKDQAHMHLAMLLRVFDVAAVNRTVIESALAAQFGDFEDAVLYCAAAHASLDAIVTRNPRDFKLAKIPVYQPNELLAILGT